MDIDFFIRFVKNNRSSYYIMYSFKKPSCYLDGTCNFVYVEKDKVLRSSKLPTTTCQTPGDLVSCGNSNIVIESNAGVASLPTNYRNLPSNAILNPQQDPSYYKPTKEGFDILTTGGCTLPHASQNPYDSTHCALNFDGRVLGGDRVEKSTVPQGWPEYLDPVLRGSIENFDPNAVSFGGLIDLNPLTSEFCIPPPATQSPENSTHCALNYQGRVLGDNMPVASTIPTGWPEYLDPVLKGKMTEAFGPLTSDCIPPVATQSPEEARHCALNYRGRVLGGNSLLASKIPTGWPEYLDPVLKGRENFDSRGRMSGDYVVVVEPASMMHQMNKMIILSSIILVLVLLWGISSK